MPYSPAPLPVRVAGWTEGWTFVWRRPGSIYGDAYTVLFWGLAASYTAQLERLPSPVMAQISSLLPFIIKAAACSAASPSRQPSCAAALAGTQPRQGQDFPELLSAAPRCTLARNLLIAATPLSCGRAASHWSISPMVLPVSSSKPRTEPQLRI